MEMIGRKKPRPVIDITDLELTMVEEFRFDQRVKTMAEAYAKLIRLGLEKANEIKLMKAENNENE